MPGVYALARANVCSALEARDMSVAYLSRLCELLEKENDRRSEAMKSMQRQRGRTNSLGQAAQR